MESERIKQLEWQNEKLSDLKKVEGVSLEELQKLRSPTRDDEIEWRIQQSGENDKRIWALIIPYIDARAVMERLDSIVGMDRWQDEYIRFDQSFLCKLSIFTRNGWVSKCDGSDVTDIEATKGGISASLKRAAVRWGIGRDLYSYGAEYAEISMERKPGFEYAKTKDKTTFYWRRDPKNKKAIIAPAPTTPKPVPPPAQPTPPPPLRETISQDQVTRLYAIARSQGWPDEEIKKHLQSFGYESSKQVLKSEYNAVVAHFEKKYWPPLFDE